MFQNFEETADPTKGAERAAALRAKLAELALDGFIVPRADEHQNEMVPQSAERLAWLTGFTGTAGFAIVLSARAALFVDGRYVLQARAQTDADLFEILQVPEAKREDWLRTHLPQGGGLGYDPRLHAIADARIELGESLVEFRILGGPAFPVLCLQDVVLGVMNDRPALLRLRTGGGDPQEGRERSENRE